MKDYAIGMFDSGLGGLTVMRELLKVLPDENMIYLGDTARLPYGAKSPETIVRYSIENANFLIQKKIKLLIIACNTASAHALGSLQQMLNVPVIGVVEPGAESAVEATKNGRIAVLGTKGTISSLAYQQAISQLNSKIEVFPIACPLFVPLVEENCIDHPATRLIVREYLKPLKEQKVDTLLLGCTHYPLLKEVIRSEIGDEITLVDSATSCAKTVLAMLSNGSLQKSSKTRGNYCYFVSDDPKKFQALGSSFLGMSIPYVECI